MSRECEQCGKTVQYGKTLARRGLAKAKGGVGIKTTGITKRKFKPNVQRVRVQHANGHVTRIKVCTKCIRSGLVRKPVTRDIPEGLRNRMRAAESHWSPEARRARAKKTAERRKARKAEAAKRAAAKTKKA